MATLDEQDLKRRTKSPLEGMTGENVGAALKQVPETLKKAPGVLATTAAALAGKAQESFSTPGPRRAVAPNEIRPKQPASSTSPLQDTGGVQAFNESLKADQGFGGFLDSLIEKGNQPIENLFGGGAETSPNQTPIQAAANEVATQSGKKNTFSDGSNALSGITKTVGEGGVPSFSGGGAAQSAPEQRSPQQRLADRLAAYERATQIYQSMRGNGDPVNAAVSALNKMRPQNADPTRHLYSMLGVNPHQAGSEAFLGAALQRAMTAPSRGFKSFGEYATFKNQNRVLGSLLENATAPSVQTAGIGETGYLAEVIRRAQEGKEQRTTGAAQPGGNIYDVKPIKDAEDNITGYLRVNKATGEYSIGGAGRGEEGSFYNDILSIQQSNLSREEKLKKLEELGVPREKQ